MTSDAQAGLREEEDAVVAPDRTPDTAPVTAQLPGRGSADADDRDALEQDAPEQDAPEHDAPEHDAGDVHGLPDGGHGGGGRGGPSVRLVPVLAVLLVLLLAATGFLWFTRPSPSSVNTADYVQVLQAARSEIVDLTSFDYQTLDEDIAQAKKISVGDLQAETVKQLNDSRKTLTAQQATVSTQVVGAAVTRADDTHGTVLMVIQSTEKLNTSQQPQVARYRIEAQLQKTGGRWLLSGISGR